MSEMSVTISPKDGERTLEQSAVRKGTASANASDLDLWLEKAEAMGERSASPPGDLEAATITYLVGAREIARRSCSRTSRVIPATRRSTT